MTIMETMSPRPGSMSLTIDQPFSLEAEQRAIGLVLHWPKTWTAFSKMRPGRVFDDNNALIWAAVVELRARKLPADLPAVFSQLAPHFGGMQDQRAQHIRDYMTNCVLSVVAVTSYRETAALLYEMACKRRLARTVANTARRISTSSVTDTASLISSDHIRQIQLDQGTDDTDDRCRRHHPGHLAHPVRPGPDQRHRLAPVRRGAGRRLRREFLLRHRREEEGPRTTTLISLVYNMIVRDDPIPIDYYCLEATAQQVFQKLLARWVSEVWCKEHDPRGYCMTDGAFRNRWIKDQDWFGKAMEAALAYFQERGLRFVSRTDGHPRPVEPDHGGRDRGSDARFDR